MVRQGEHVFVMEALTMHSSDPDVVAYGFQTLQIIARCVQGQTTQLVHTNLSSVVTYLIYGCSTQHIN